MNELAYSLFPSDAVIPEYTREMSGKMAKFILTFSANERVYLDIPASEEQSRQACEEYYNKNDSICQEVL